MPQRSPFRYPGGKTWLVPYVREWLRSKPTPPSRLIEPFAGGAIVSLTVAFERLAKHVIFTELDDGVAAVWRIVLNGQAEWLAKRILNFEVTLENVRNVLDRPVGDLREKAFQTLLRNRVQRGGILAAGAGLVKDGENGRGLLSRWYPGTLARRIRAINREKDRVTFVEGDAFAPITEHRADEDAVFYIDPPYTLAARSLYTKWQIDHPRLFDLMRTCRGDFLMSYDNTAEIAGLAKRYGFEACPVGKGGGRSERQTHLLVGKNINRWLNKTDSL